MDGLCFSLRRAFNNPPLRHGMKDVGGVAGFDDFNVVAGVNYVGRVLGGGHGALLRRRPWGAVKRLRRQGGDYFRNEEPPRRRGRYTKMTASRRSSKGAKVLLRWMPSRLSPLAVVVAGAVVSRRDGQQLL